MKIKYTKNCTTVINSYTVQEEKYIKVCVKAIMQYRKSENLPVTRTKKSYVSEWKAHNRLYNLGIARNHTKNVDLEENLSKKTEIIWRILGI